MQRIKWGRGVAVNMPPCQGGDRGFESRRSRSGCVPNKNGTHPFLFPHPIPSTTTEVEDNTEAEGVLVGVVQQPSLSYVSTDECTSPHLARQCTLVIRITKYIYPLRSGYRHQSAAFALAG